MNCKYCGGSGMPDGSQYCCWCGKSIAKKRVTKTGVTVPKARQLPSGNWFIQLRLDGQSISITEQTEKACVTEATRVKSEYLAGTAIKKPKSDTRTLNEILIDYIQSKENVLSPSTVKGYYNIARSRFLAYQDTRVCDIDYQKMINDECALGLSSKTVHNGWGIVEAALSYAGIPAPKVTLPRKPKSDEPFLTPAEIPVFLSALYGQDCELSALLALHSLRRSEVFALTWDDVNLNAREIYVRKAAVKDKTNTVIYKPLTKTSASTRTVPIMIDRLCDVLKAAEPKTGRLVKCDLETPKHQIDRLCDAAGVTRVGMHGLRRSFASLGYSLGIPERVIMRVGGWSDFKTVHEVYVKLSDEFIGDEMSKMSEYYSGQISY